MEENMQRFSKFISLSALLLALVTVSFGQDLVGSIEVTTKDSAGALVPGVALTIRSTQGTAGFRRTVTTDNQGFVRVPQVPPGVYEITAAATAGFAETRQNVSVELGRASQVSLQLGVSAEEEVTITGGDVGVDTTNSEISKAISTKQIDSLPKGTGFTSILKVVPGVRAESLTGGFTIDGASKAENTFIIDGQEVTNYRNADLNSNNNIPFSLVQEVQVKSSGFNAEFGGATGGVVSVVTKGGDNEFRGDFGVQFEPSKLQGSNRPSLTRFTSGSVDSTAYVQTQEYIQSPKSQYLDSMPSFNLRGPIIKDRLWFFGSYSPSIREQTVTSNFFSNAPSATRVAYGSQTYKYKSINEYSFIRLDASPFSKLRLTGTYLYNPLKQIGALPYGTISLSGNIPNSSANCVNFGGSIGTYCGNDLTSRQGGMQTSNNITGQAVYTPFSSVVATFRYSRGFLNESLETISNRQAFVTSAPTGILQVLQTGDLMHVRRVLTIRRTTRRLKTFLSAPTMRATSASCSAQADVTNSKRVTDISRSLTTFRRTIPTVYIFSMAVLSTMTLTSHRLPSLQARCVHWMVPETCRSCRDACSDMQFCTGTVNSDRAAT